MRPVSALVFRCSFAAAGWAGPLFAQPAHHVATGFARLQSEQGAALATGAGLALAHIEPTVVEDQLVHRPNVADAEFAGRTFTFTPTEGGTTSGHATATGKFFYGRATSFLPGATTILAPEANAWLVAAGLRTLTHELPAADLSAVQSHSWIGLASEEDDPAAFPDILARIDAVIDRDGPTVVVGLNNGASHPVPLLLAPAYHVIAVGRTDGQHSAGLTTVAGAGRTKPDLVAPAGVTSHSTPMVASAAALLRATARQQGALAAAEDPRVIKALLLAGATKEEFPAWSRTSSRPLDTRFGAGELNVYLSHATLTAGRQPAAPDVVRRARGWDHRSTAAPGTARLYVFDVPPGNTAPRFSAALTWHRHLTAAPAGPEPEAPLAWTSTVPDLTLQLFAITGGFALGDLVATSASPVDNVEHLYAPALPPGRYALAVTSDTANVTYGLAWRTLPTVAVVATRHGGKSNLAPARFTVTRSGDRQAPLRLAYTLGGSAVAGADYPAPAGTLEFPLGAAAVDLVVTPTGAAPRDTDTLTLQLVADFPYTLAGAGTATAQLFGDAYPSWLAQHFDAAEIDAAVLTGETADPEADGAANLLEYALGGDPRDGLAPAPMPAATLEDGQLVLRWTMPPGRDDVVTLAEGSDNLVTWSSDPEVVVTLPPVVDAAGSHYEARATRAPADSAHQFLRVRVTRTVP